MKMFSIFYKNRHPMLGRYSLLLITLSWLGEVHAQCPTLTGINRAICFGTDPTTLSSAFRVSGSNAGATITWYKADGTTTITNNNIDKTTLSAQDFDAAYGTTFSQNAAGAVYEVKVSQTTGTCTESVKVSVYVVLQPQLPGVAVPTSSAGNGVCNGNDITLTSDSPGDMSVGGLTLKTEILWSAAGGGGVSFSPPEGRYTSNKAYATIEINGTVPSGGVSRSFSYVREYKEARITTLGAPFDVATCSTASSGNLDIMVSPKPSGPVATMPAASTVCPNLDFTLTLQGTTDGTVKEWVKVFGMSINSIENITTSLSQRLSVQGSYTYYATLVKTNDSGKNCETSTQAATVVIAGIANNPASTSACVGENARFSSSVVPPAVGSGTSLTFTWQVDKRDGNGFVTVPPDMGSSSPSGSSSDLTISVLAAYNNYKYRLVTVYGGDCTITSAAATLTVKTPPSLDTGGDLSAALAVCRAEAFTLQARGSGAGPVSCQWQQKLTGANTAFTDIGNAQTFPSPPSPTGFTTTFSFLAADVNGNIAGTIYRVKITDSNCTIYTTECTLSLKEKPAFTTNDPLDAAVCVGGTAAFSVDAATITKTGTLVYQWIKTTGTADSNVGTNSNSYTTPSTVMADNGNRYRVTITDDNQCSPVPSRIALLTVNPKPSITKQPVNNIDKCDGSAVSFTVEATTNNGTLRYQWEEATRTDPGTFTAIPVSTNATADKSTLTLQNVSNKDGYKYRVKLTDDKCNITSNTVNLAVNAPFSTTLNPANADVCEGQAYTYTASVNGLSATATPVYQWKKWNTALNAFENISGAANASYVISPAQAALDGSKYAVYVTIGGTTCTQSSGISTLHVRPYPVVNPQPQSQSLCEGDNVTFTTGGSTAQGTLAYQWQEASGTGTFSNLSGETNTTLLFTNLPGTKNGYRYQAVLNNGFCSITTDIATLTLNPPPTPGTLLSTPETCIGVVYTYSLTNSSGGTLKYQWQEESGGTFVNAGAEGTATTCDVAASQTQTTKKYKVIVRIDNTACKRESNVSTLTVNPLPTLTVKNPVGCVGQAASLSVKAEGASPFTYQWKEGTANVGTNSDTFVVSSVQTTDAGRVFTVTITDSKTCSATSSEIRFVVDSPPGIDTQPNSQTVCSNEPVTFSVVPAQSNPAPSLQWQEALAAATGVFTAISGATGNSYRIENTAGKNGNLYRVLLSNTNCTNTGSTATLTVNDAPVISAFTPASGAVCAEKDVTYTVTATGSTPHYQWQQNRNTGTFADVDNNDQNTFVMTGVTTSQSGYVTKVRVTYENDCSAVSDLSTLTVKPLPDIAAVANPAAICSLTTTNVELRNPNNLPGTAYTWTVAAPATITGSSAQSTALQGPISQTLTSTATSDVTVTYTVTPSADGCEGHTANAVVTVRPHPDVQATPDITTFCTGGKVTIALSTPKNLANTQYTWSVNASSKVTGWQNQTTAAAGSSIEHTLVSTSSQSEDVVYTITPTTKTPPPTTGCDGPAAVVTLVVQSKVSITTNLEEKVTVCPGAQMTLAVEAKGSPTLEYQWQRDGQDIANATEASYKMAVNDPDNGAKFKVSIKNPCDRITSIETALTVSPEVAFANTEVNFTPAGPGYLEPVNFTYKGPLPAQSFDWNFGDGTTHSTFQDPAHNYTALGPQVVNLTVTLPDNCHKTFALNLTVTGKAPDIITGDAVNQYGIGFYPVPLEEKLNVYAEKQLVSVSLSTITGSRMISSSVNGNKVSINTSSLTSGIYILSIETEKGIAHFKVVK